jgi:hypothetical protein
MPYNQLKPFNQSTAGKLVGYCLQNVRKGYGIAPKYSNAITAWAHTAQHADRNVPGGVDVPLYYTYGHDGHINVRLANGQVWSDGHLYPSIDNYLTIHPLVHYLGWGESVNGVQVIQYVAPKFTLYKNYVPANAVGRRVYLSNRVESWNVYKPGTRTLAGVLKPSANPGMSYIVRGIDSLPNRVLIQSGIYGRVSLPVDADATFK